MNTLLLPGQIPLVPKDPDATLDYSIDWTPWLLERDDTIQSISFAAAGVSIVSSSFLLGVVTVWLSGGTLGDRVLVTCSIVTVGGRSDDRSFRLRITNM